MTARHLVLADQATDWYVATMAAELLGCSLVPLSDEQLIRHGMVLQRYRAIRRRAIRRARGRTAA